MAGAKKSPQNDTKPVVVSQTEMTVSPTQSRSFRRVGVWLAVAGIVLLAIIGAVVLSTNRTTPKLVAAHACSDSFIVQRANPALQQSDTNVITALAKLVQTKSNYDKDPNCLYIVTLYYGVIADKSNTKASFTKLKTIYDPKVGFSPAFSPKAELSILEGYVQSVDNTTGGVTSTVESQL